MSPARRVNGAGEATRKRHSWLELLQTSGPFLTLPVVHRVFPDGLPPVSADRRGAVRHVVERMLATQGEERRAVIDELLSGVLDWGEHHRDDLPDALGALVVEHRVTVHPDLAFVVDEAEESIPDEDVPDDDAGGSDDDAAEAAEPTGPPSGGASPWRLFGRIEPWGTHPLARTTRDGWTANAAERLAVLLRARDVPVGLVTDGRWWAIVWAPRRAATGVAVFDASLFSEEPDSLAAFAALLGRQRFLGVAAPDTLPRLLEESLERGEELTDALGRQVRDAVELLVRTLDRLDADSGGALLARVDDDELYRGVITVMMRVVFLLFAEERRLLPSDDEVYASAYSVGRLVDDLDRVRALAGPQSLDYRYGAWHRLLATARAVHGGVHHEDLRLPAYGSDLFDPNRFPWLEGRAGEESSAGATVPAVDDRTVWRMLRAVQFVTVGVEWRRLTFRALGVEQIGYVYEGLLELEVRTADELTLLLARHSKWPRQKMPTEVGVAEARTWVDGLPDTLQAEVAARIGWTASRVEKALREVLDEHVLAEEVGDAEPEAFKVAVALAPVLRRDERERPMVVRPGRRYLAPSRRRAATGAHYTPPQLALEIATGALEPLVYFPGPLQTADRSEWRLRPSRHLLGLRVADIAMGSGAFLVSACRYLADCVVTAEADEGDLDAERWVGAGEQADAEVPPVLLEARRRVVERCLYGVDVNPLAVDMAKLSLWLLTMDRERPFDFLDGRLVAGDSLLGLVEVDQLTTLHLDPVAGRALREVELPFTDAWVRTLGEAADVRNRANAIPPEGLRDIERKQRQLREARALTAHLRAVADRLVGIGLSVARTRTARDVRSAFVALGLEMSSASGDDDAVLKERAQPDLQAERPDGRAPRTPFHWPVEFPEVFVDSPDRGFDAIIGNPPFLGGSKLRGAVGYDLAGFLQRWDGRDVKGNADLAARFVLRAQRLLSSRGQLGYIATNTLVQGDTLEVGLAQSVARGMTIRRGRTSHPWPSASANLEIVDVWASRAPVGPLGERRLDDEPVPAIGADLEPVGRVGGAKHRLAENANLVFNGSKVDGLGFTMSEDEALQLISEDARHAEALQRYIIGQDLNQRPDCSASRWIINFRGWSLDQAKRYPELLAIVQRDVKPERDRNARAQRRDRWWIYGERAPNLYAAISNLEHVLAISMVSNAVMPVRVPANQVFAHKCAVFGFDGFAELAVLSSSIHTTWTVRYTSTLETRVNYSPSDVFLTLPRPVPTPWLDELGARLDTERRELMFGRGWGLTTTYNHVHDPADRDPAVVALRDLHADIDHAVMDAYGWSDLDLNIGHHPTRIGIRWTVGPDARFELLDRLLEENQRRYAAEQGAK
ncbi:Eco57I restriction-modification methylase domain-containing protein [Actinomycetospora sp. CA-101289]|uniref:Eco57I restriction-modification methylase domain-containing protein n=1 Tax=Actinomycetospora sp. CA-101289 TaxID=3239893 RepID=UPI003D983FB5